VFSTKFLTHLRPEIFDEINKYRNPPKRPEKPKTIKKQNIHKNKGNAGS